MNWSENAVRQPVAALTVEAWVRATDADETGPQTLVSQWSPGDAKGDSSTFSLHYCDKGGTDGTPPGPCFVVNTDGGVAEVRTPGMLSPGWRHLAGIYDGSTVSLLVDGQVVARSNATGQVKPCDAPVISGYLEPGAGRFKGHIERVRIFHAVVAETEMGMVSYDAHKNIPRGLELRLQPDDFFILDDRQELKGYVAIHADEASIARLKEVGDTALELTLRPRGTSEAIWSTTLPLELVEARFEIPFFLPLEHIEGGYYELSVRLLGHGAPIEGLAPGRADRRQVVFSKLRMGRAPAPASPGRSARYLTFVKETMDILTKHQSARLGGEPDGVLFLTGNGKHHTSRGSLVRKADGRLQFGGRFPANPFEMEPRRCDLELWPLLDELSRLSGDGAYAHMVDEMADAMARVGFDPRSGLFYYSEESDFDVVAQAPRGVGDDQVPRFKPHNTGNCPEMPQERLWKHAPRQMLRCARSMFQGLVTDPERMDFNRFTFFDYDDDGRRPAMTATPSNLGFDSAATRIIHWWAAAYGRAGDTDCLSWARRMTDKWRAVQHPDSGLVPNFFGDGAWNPGEAQPVGAWAEIRGTALTAAGFLDAVDELNRRPGAEDLADLLKDMARRLALGVARHSYDPARRIFLEHLHLDGRPQLESARYAFHTQAEKDEAMRADPSMAEVPVYMGDAWYQPGTFHRLCAGTTIPWHLALVAERSGDEELKDRLIRMTEDALQAATEITGPFTGEARWTFHATGLYVKLLVSLHRMTGEGRYLDQARALADAELDRLPAVACPEWWRLRERAVFLDALLCLYEAVA